MRLRAALIVLAVVSFVTPLPVRLARGAAAPPASSAPDRVLGDWNGALDVAGRKLRIVFHLSKGADGGLAGTMDSPDQGANGIDLDAVSLSGDTLRLGLKLGNASYRGVLSADHSTFRGTWAQSGYTFPLDLGRESAPERRRPQDPVKPYPYGEDEVRVENAPANLRLACTFTKPQGPGPFPAVLLITGSGPQNRDEEIMGHRPFLVLADHLTRHGLAVLRCDDRGTAQSTGDFATATTADFATDARAEFEYLLARPDVDRAHVGLIGHSEGAIIAPMLAARDPRVAFIVMLAGPGVPGDSLLQLQVEALARAAGKTDSEIARKGALERELLALVGTERDSATAAEKMHARMMQELQALPESERPADIDRVARMQAAQATSPWFRWFAAYDPRPALQKTACPVLALIGGRDRQVPPSENLPAISRALHAGGNTDVSTVELPGLNHLFQTSTTGMPAEYGGLEETFAPAALDTITAWIEARVKSTR